LSQRLFEDKTLRQFPLPFLVKLYLERYFTTGSGNVNVRVGRAGDNVKVSGGNMTSTTYNNPKGEMLFLRRWIAKKTRNQVEKLWQKHAKM